MSLINKDALRQMMIGSGLPFQEDDLEEGLRYLENFVLKEFNEVVGATKRARQNFKLDKSLGDLAEEVKNQFDEIDKKMTSQAELDNDIRKEIKKSSSRRRRVIK